jgi:hypothetical protein
MRAFSSVFIRVHLMMFNPKQKKGIIMSNSIALVNGESSIVLSNKTGKTGSFARAIVFATKEVRQGVAQSMYLNWLQNGTYRPIANDIIDTLVAKSAQSFVRGMIPPTGGIKKEQLINLCVAIDNSVRVANKELKGQKAFVYGLVRTIVQEVVVEGDVIDAE